MSVQISESHAGRTLIVRPSGTLTRDDYAVLVPRLDAAVQRNGQIDLLVDMRGFDGMTAGALWEDLKVDVEHAADVRRMAVVGDRKWHEWMARFTRPFTSAEVRYFEESEGEQAAEFVDVALPPPAR